MGQEIWDILRVLFVTGFALVVALNGETKMRKGKKIIYY